MPHARGASRDHPPLRPLPVPQRGARAREHAGRGGVPRRGRLSGAAESRWPPDGEALAGRGICATGSTMGMEERRMAATTYDVAVIGAGPGGYVAAIRAAQLGLQDGGDRARAPGRHLPQLGLHPDQGAAALVGDFSPDAPGEGVRAEGGERRLRHRRRGDALAGGGQAAVGRRRLPDEEEQDRRGDGRGEARRARARSRSRPTRGPRRSRRSRSSSRPGRGRATCRGSRRTASGSGATSTR